MLTFIDALPPALLRPPVEARAADIAGAYTAVIGVCFVVGAAVCAREAVRRHDALPLIVLLSGLLAVVGEPIVDNLGAVWYPADNPVVPYTAMGVPQPLFLQLGYPLFWGAIVYAWYRLLGEGRIGLWPLFGIVAAFDLFVEILGVKVLEVGIYYGPAPFRVAGFPLWWAPVNAAVSIVAARLLLHLVPLLKGWRRLALLPVSPAAFVGTHAVTAWPVWLTMHSDVPQVVRWAAATLTVGLVLGLMALVKSTMTNSTPAASTGR